MSLRWIVIASFAIIWIVQTAIGDLSSKATNLCSWILLLSFFVIPCTSLLSQHQVINNEDYLHVLTQLGDTESFNPWSSFSWNLSNQECMQGKQRRVWQEIKLFAFARIQKMPWHSRPDMKIYPVEIGLVWFCTLYCILPSRKLCNGWRPNSSMVKGNRRPKTWMSKLRLRYQNNLLQLPPSFHLDLLPQPTSSIIWIQHNISTYPRNYHEACCNCRGLWPPQQCLGCRHSSSKWSQRGSEPIICSQPNQINLSWLSTGTFNSTILVSGPYSLNWRIWVTDSNSLYRYHTVSRDRSTLTNGQSTRLPITNYFLASHKTPTQVNRSLQDNPTANFSGSWSLGLVLIMK